MAVVHEKFDAVIFGCDRIRIGFRDLLQDFDRFHVHFIAAGRTGFSAEFAADQQGRFLGEMLQILEDFFNRTGWHPQRRKTVAGALPYTDRKDLNLFAITFFGDLSG